jgi:hypothetical protein
VLRLLQSLGVLSIATIFSGCFFLITVSHPLNVSVPMGHLQVEYILVNVIGRTAGSTNSFDKVRAAGCRTPLGVLSIATIFSGRFF